MRPRQVRLLVLRRRQDHFIVDQYGGVVVAFLTGGEDNVKLRAANFASGQTGSYAGVILCDRMALKERGVTSLCETARLRIKFSATSLLTYGQATIEAIRLRFSTFLIRA